VWVIGFYWHAVQRDLIGLGLHAADMFTPRLTAAEVLSLIVAAPNGSAIRDTLADGYISHRLPVVLKEHVAAKPKKKKTQEGFKSIAEFEAHRAKVFKTGRS
jgi:hypothetical protein